MELNRSTVGSDVLHGTVFGLGLAGAIWTVPDPALLDPVCLAFVGLCGLLGPLRQGIPGGSRISYAYPFVLAGLVLFGVGPALLGAVLGASLAAVVDRPGRRDLFRQIAFRAGRAALTVVIAGGAYRTIGGSFEGALSRDLIGPLLAYTVAYCLVDVVIALIEAVASGIRPSRRPWLVLRCFALLAGTVVAPLVIAIHQHAAARIAFLALLPIAVVHLLGRTRQVAESSDRPGVSETIYPAIVRALATARVDRDGRSAADLERVQQLCLAVGHRLELTDAEMAALAASGVLHDVGALALPEPSGSRDSGATVHAHPRLAAEIIAAIDFPYPVREFVEHQHERWDGRGRPLGLRAHDIPMGARILAAVVGYERIASGAHAPDPRARAFLRGESGSRLDPLVVEVLLDEIDREAEATTPETAVHATASSDAAPTPERIPLTRVDRELRVLDEIRRTFDLRLGLEQRLTLVASTLSDLVPFDDLVVLVADPVTSRLHARFALGRSASELPLFVIPQGTAEEAIESLAQRLESQAVLPLIVDGRIRGALIVYREDDPPFTHRERRTLVCVAGQVANAVVCAEPVSTRGTTFTDPLTGLPNASFLDLEASHRQLHDDTAFGLVALHVRGVDLIGSDHGAAVTERLICGVAKRLAAACHEDETLVRFGPDEFIVSTPRHHPGDLVARWSELCRCIEAEPFRVDDAHHECVRLTAAHACHPADGADLADLLAVLESRLSLHHHERTIVPFRAARSAS